MKFTKTNNLIYIAFVIHIIIALIFGAKSEIMAIIVSIPLMANLIGLYFISFTNKIKLGAKIFMITSYFFIPIGIIGIIACRQILDKIKEDNFLKELNDEKRV